MFAAALTDDLTARRTARLRAMLTDRPTVALAAAVHALALPVSYMGGESGFALHVVTPALRAEGIEDSAAAKSLTDQHAASRGRLPNGEAAPWEGLLAQDGGTVTGLLAYCVACTVKPVRHPRADQVAAAVSPDMAQWRQPTVPGYFGRVPKPLILEAGRSGGGQYRRHEERRYGRPRREAETALQSIPITVMEYKPDIMRRIRGNTGRRLH